MCNCNGIHFTAETCFVLYLALDVYFIYELIRIVVLLYTVKRCNQLTNAISSQNIEPFMFVFDAKDEAL